MPSPHTLGSIMHQPLAALTPLLLFPLENRTSTHPPSTPVRLPLPAPLPVAPLAALPQPPPRRLPSSATVSLAFVRQSSTARTTTTHPPSPSPSSEFRLCLTQRGDAHLPPSVRAHDFCRPFPSSIFFAMFPPLSLRSTRSHPFYPALLPFSIFAPLSLAPSEETSLVFVAISVFPSHRTCRHRRRSGAPLSGLSHALRSSHPLCSSCSEPGRSFHLSLRHSLRSSQVHTYTFSNILVHIHTYVRTVICRLPLADYLPRSFFFFTLSQPRSPSCLTPSSFLQLIFHGSSLSPSSGESSPPEPPSGRNRLPPAP